MMTPQKTFEIATFVAIGVVIIALGFAIQQRSTQKNSALTPEDAVMGAPLIQTTGAVVAVDRMLPQIAVTVDGVTKTVVVSPGTRIMQSLIQKDASGAEIKRTLIEVNLGELYVGDVVKIAHHSEVGDILSKVERIDFSSEQPDVDMYIKELMSGSKPVVRGQVVAVDAEQILLMPYNFDGPGTMAVSMVFPEGGVPVYSIDDTQRVHVAHARVEAEFGDVRAGQMVQVVVDDTQSTREKIVVSEIILSSK